MLQLTSKYYSAKLGQDVSRGMVRRFRRQFAEVTGLTGPGVSRPGLNLACLKFVH